MKVTELIEYIVGKFGHDRTELALDIAPKKLPSDFARVYIEDREYGIHSVEHVDIDRDGDLILYV